MKNILITGGAGFIGSHLVKRFVHNYPDYNIYNIDNLTYAGSLKNVKEIENKKNYFFLKLDINNHKEILKLFKDKKISDVIHLAAESHVDRSIESSFEFAKTNVLGTLSLLEACKKSWNLTSQNNFFYHISTDEVYGSLGLEGSFNEKTKYDPNSPYSASKASSDHFVRAYNKTYGLPILISNCSNNYGPFQHNEKLIPNIINSLLKGRKIPIYGDGKNIRDWLFVDDHCDAIELIFTKGKNGETYNIGGGYEISNIDLAQLIIKIFDKIKLNPSGLSEDLIEFVNDRPGHDFRYSIDFSKIKNSLGWKPKTNFEEGILKTINYYLKIINN
jgi:dTDP-glucose 4,6-dehydratase